ncbi:hypothetical protein F5146DRAFT_1202326 [Armillaria mellea]|nr:hypothetical protein F5146DRAFT_1202326 [Armillaria mellea]
MRHTSHLEDLPLKLLQQVLSRLDIPTLKCLSLASSILHAACFPYIFRPVVFSGPTCKMHMIGLAWIMEDVSASLLPWCAEVHTLKINSGNVRNTSIIPSLGILRDMELSRLTFWAVEDYFGLLTNLPPTLKKLAVHGILLRFDDFETGCYTTVRRGAEIEHLETHLAEDLSALLRDDCPITLRSFRVAYVPQARLHDLEDLVQRTPNLIDLRLDIATPENRPVFLPLPRLKSLSITDGTQFSDTLIELFSRLSSLEVLNLVFPLGWLVDALDNFAMALSQLCFRNLKGLNLEGCKISTKALGVGDESDDQIHSETSARSQRVQYYAEFILTPTNE